MKVEIYNNRSVWILSVELYEIKITSELTPFKSAPEIIEIIKHIKETITEIKAGLE